MSKVLVLVLLVGSIILIGATENTGYRYQMAQFAIPAVEESGFNQWGISVTDDDIQCLAENIYFEARGEGIEGQYAVSEVVVFRVMHHDYPDTVCGVVKDGKYKDVADEYPIRHRCQFSWFCDGKSDEIKDMSSFKKSLQIAEEVLRDSEYNQRLEYALFYHNGSVTPYWVASMNFVGAVGYHKFYN